MWRELIRKCVPEIDLAPPASDETIRVVEEALSVRLPEQLAALLLETDGVTTPDGLNAVWPCERIVSDNLMFRTNEAFGEIYMPFDPLLFFGDLGNGDQVAYAIVKGVVSRPGDIFLWNHEDDSRSFFTFTLERYLGDWLGPMGVRPDPLLPSLRGAQRRSNPG